MHLILKTKLLAHTAFAGKTALLGKSALLAIAPVALMAAGSALPYRHAAPEVATVSVPAGDFQYRVAGDFHRGGRPVNAPVRTYRVAAPVAVMAHQVSAADYDRCVAEKACPRRAAREPGRADLPVTGVSWQDATAYAEWFSTRTGQHWRLPTDAEWAYAAGSRFQDDAIVGDDGKGAFSRRWLARYDQESDRQVAIGKAPKPFGSFGTNERGIADFSGNVWEWTDTCFLRQGLDEAGEPSGARTMNCGVRVVEGEHRAYVTDFIRDAKAGGCAVGIPPANLGFRLVRDERGIMQDLVARVKRLAPAGV